MHDCSLSVEAIDEEASQLPPGGVIGLGLRPVGGDLFGRTMRIERKDLFYLPQRQPDPPQHFATRRARSTWSSAYQR